MCQTSYLEGASEIIYIILFWIRYTGQCTIPLGKLALIWSAALLQHAMNNGWLQDGEGKSNLVNLLSSVREASLGMAQLHREDIIHGALCPSACFLKAARNQRGFVVKVCCIAVSA